MISLQFITHQTERYSYLESARMALEGGCKWIQLRMKEAPLEEVEAVALQLKPLCKEHEAILVLDDHVELARKLEVDGVHLGKKDMPIDQARQILGEAFIIGGTANTFVVAIGGITYEDIPAILHTGVNGIALSGTILGADNPVEETRRILNHA